MAVTIVRPRALVDYLRHEGNVHDGEAERLNP